MSINGPQKRGQILTGRMVLFIFLSFFGIVITANTIMMIVAAHTYDGVQEEGAYRKGRDYNDRLKAARTQKALGWQVDFSHEAQGDRLTRLVSAGFRDANGRPLDHLSVEAEFFSPVEQDHDRRSALISLGNGQYQAVIRLPRAGRWEFRIRAYEGDLVRYYLYKESLIRP